MCPLPEPGLAGRLFLRNLYIYSFNRIYATRGLQLSHFKGTALAGPPYNSRMTRISYTKMAGLGNDFMVLRGAPVPASGDIVRLADRASGVGFDQLLWLDEPRNSDEDVFYRVFNADGGEVEQCGNGARCIVRHIAGANDAPDRIWRLGFPGGVVTGHLLPDGNVAVAMGEPQFSPASLPFVADTEQETYDIQVNAEIITVMVASMGNPHAVLDVDDVDSAPVERLGPLLERHERFPNRANIGFRQFVSPERIRLRVFERGVGETQACGTGACAAVVTGQRAGLLAADVQVELPGGELRVRWAGAGTPVWLIGAAVTVSEGVVEV
jgi:diaminopimelate epimerase